ncbi:hypothetical protein [Streptomyces sp. CBMA29]|uniref:hypothetical protein n=1 Tax=Streptomyces sp. CBMA29 TaxID=1896314 RepID=UPI001661DE23|nr:hypothetical protein [Streptomyces sp. CBMA29]MBD0739055.1 hypothetical protein [Streptomyces sp. CBMA29]
MRASHCFWPPRPWAVFNDFLSKKVYQQATRPGLRLITCAGTYSRATGYSGNIVAPVATASPAATWVAPW